VVTGAAGAVLVVAVIAVLVVREASAPPGARTVTPATLPLLLLAGAILVARAVAVLG
jgi:hypothetical protein